MFQRWREKFQRFMIGRYGMDQLNQFLMYAVLILIVVNIFLGAWLLELAIVLGLVIMYVRMFSRNINRRYKENQRYLSWQFKVSQRFQKWKFRFTEGRKYKIFKCPSCGQKVRVPRGHGKVSIHCPKCGSDFIKRT